MRTLAPAAVQPPNADPLQRILTEPPGPPYPPGVAYTSHIGQDAWVAACLRGKHGGYFLDIGAFDGKTISNTLALERDFGWKGICVEPNPAYYAQLCECRRTISVNAALWTRSNQRLNFVDAHGLSAIETFKDGDINSARRSQATRAVIEVDTLTPTDLLRRFKAPTLIDYLTLDVEGAEYDVLSAIDFETWRFGLMTIEHNHDTPRQEKVRHYLAQYGYEVCANRNDDFFFHRGHLSELLGGPGPDPAEACRRVHDSFPICETGPKAAPAPAPAAPKAEAVPSARASRSQPDLSGQSSEILKRDAEALFQIGAWDKAAARYKVLTSRMPDEVTYWQRRIQCMEEQGSQVVADLLREEALQAHPEWSVPLGAEVGGR